MLDFNKINKIKRRIRFENPIAVGVEHENGDMEYMARLVDGEIVEFYVPKAETFIKCDRLQTQEYAVRILKHLKTDKII